MEMLKYLFIGCVVGFLLGMILKVPKLLGLGLPILYSLIVMWIPGWSTEHSQLANGIFYGLIAIAFLPWLIEILEHIHDHRIRKRIEQQRIARIIEQLKQKQGIA